MQHPLLWYQLRSLSIGLIQPQGWMADGVPGPKKVHAAQLAEGESRGARGPATVRCLLVGEAIVLAQQLNSPTATLSVVVMMYS